ncbi:hypothetical protein [Deinococcus reticulitermitis]|uniref:hypothetical protein n=1 Tax=Deinococcus reticulitermitis TaxID=856736 RepID=UPI0011600C1E|nr:hypothetical protein [Deinococcus reticulitermitis]
MTRTTLRFSLALLGLIAVLALFAVAYLLAVNGQTWEAVAVGPGGAFGVVKSLFTLFEKLGA